MSSELDGSQRKLFSTGPRNWILLGNEVRPSDEEQAQQVRSGAGQRLYGATGIRHDTSGIMFSSSGAAQEAFKTLEKQPKNKE